MTFGRARRRETCFFAVQLRPDAPQAAVAGRYLCHERDAVDARLAATGLTRACGMHSFTLAEVVPPAEGWGRTELPELGGKLEVTNLFTWSQILDARQPD
jgi:hypothetical protein